MGVSLQRSPKPHSFVSGGRLAARVGREEKEREGREEGKADGRERSSRSFYSLTIDTTQPYTLNLRSLSGLLQISLGLIVSSLTHFVKIG